MRVTRDINQPDKEGMRELEEATAEQITTAAQMLDAFAEERARQGKPRARSLWGIGQEIQQATGLSGNALNCLSKIRDPQSSLSKRFAAFRDKIRQAAAEVEAKERAAQHQAQVEELKRRLVDQRPEDYAALLKVVRKPDAPVELPPERVVKSSASARYRRLLREKIPLQERVEILARLAKSAEDGVAIKALQMIHAVEGVNRKPQDAPPSVARGSAPMFELPGELPVSVQPVREEG